jgi:hypothetical protein
MFRTVGAWTTLHGQDADWVSTGDIDSLSTAIKDEVFQSGLA